MPDAYVSTGHTTQWGPTCARKGPTAYRGTVSTTAGLDVRDSARVADKTSPLRTIAYGSPLFFSCQVVGESYGGSTLWDRVVAPWTGWVPDAYVHTGHTTQWGPTCTFQGPRPPSSTVTTVALTKYAEAQTADNYCGPAAIRTMLVMLHQSPGSQATLAVDSSTSSIGTFPNAFAGALNDFGYSYASYGIDTNADLWTFVTGRINRHLPVALMVASENWRGGKFLEAHWIVVYGYRTDSANGAATYLISDPGDGTYQELDRGAWEQVVYRPATWVSWLIGGVVVG